MYLVGAAHPHKADCQIVLERLAASRERLVTDAEVLQEILHRYTSIGRYEAISKALQVLLEIVDEVFPIEEFDVFRASGILQSERRFSARDAIHLAVMERHGVERVFSFDGDFDDWHGIKRIRI